MSKTKTKITIAVTGLNNTDNPGPGVPVIRSLKESTEFDVRIIGLVYETLEPGIYMEGLCDKIFQIPYPSAGSDELIDRIEQIHNQDKIDVLIPNFDSELFSFMKNEERLLRSGIHTFLPTMKQFQEREKDKLIEYGEKYGIKVPASINLGSLGQISEIKEKLKYPVMVKGQFYDAYVANNLEQVKQIFHKISDKWGLPVIIQEFVKGTEVNVIALGDGLGNTIAAVPMRKQYITDKGKAWGGITLSDEKNVGNYPEPYPPDKVERWDGTRTDQNGKRRILPYRNQSPHPGMGLPRCGGRSKYSRSPGKTCIRSGGGSNGRIQGRKNVCALFLRHPG